MKRPYVNLKSKHKINDFMLVLQNNIKILVELFLGHQHNGKQEFLK